MTPPRRSRELYLLIVCLPAVLYTAGTATAQDAPLRPPVISRMCLWNADKEVWRSLRLYRDQVRHLNVLRQRYPAVVQGQWTSGPDSADMDTREPGQPDPVVASYGSAQGLRAQASGPISGNPHGPEGRMQRMGLQAELREVLTYTQLRRWEALCGPNK